MGREEMDPLVKEFLDRLADLLAEKYFERMDERIKRIPELRRLVTAKEAAQYLSLSTETVYRLASQKKLPYLKIGGRVLFDLKALDRWIEKRMVREKEWKREELKGGEDREKIDLKGSKESNLLTLLRKKGRE